MKVGLGSIHQMKKIIFILLSLIIIFGFFYYSKNTFGKEVYVRAVKDFFVEKKTTPLLFTGDIMLGRNVEVLMKRDSSFSPFGATSELLKGHITISNLEGSIPKNHTPTPMNTFSFSFPDYSPQYLKDNGIQAVSLANNHSFDNGKYGYNETRESLLKAGISSFGAYDKTESNFFKTNIGTIEVVVYGVNMISSSWDEAKAYETTETLRKSNVGAILIAFIHWGNEYDLTQGEVQRIFAHKLIDSGVNVIVGSHPHVVQGIEVYKNSPIFYSLGNFVFDQYFSKDVQRGYFLSIDKNGDNFVYRIIPIESTKSYVTIAGERVADEILNTIAKSSDINLQEDIRNGEVRIKMFP